MYDFCACGIFAACLFPISVKYLQNVFEIINIFLEILLPILNLSDIVFVVLFSYDSFQDSPGFANM